MEGVQYQAKEIIHGEITQLTEAAIGDNLTYQVFKLFREEEHDIQVEKPGLSILFVAAVIDSELGGRRCLVVIVRGRICNRARPEPGCPCRKSSLNSSNKLR
ncbi:hypothetical protein K1719_040321 [Acacia pycnantha]|nr:hypothetical protein K1719_040321 [Acacia pycnantha]